MRLLGLAFAGIASGCCCGWEWEEPPDPPDECSSDEDCPGAGGSWCDGYGVCRENCGFFGPCQNVCEIEYPYCGSGYYCEPAFGACAPCAPGIDAWECEGGPDAGGPLPDASVDPVCDSTGLPGEFGAACDEAGACGPELECFPASSVTAGPIERAIAERCTASCDPEADTCGACARCLDTVRVGYEALARDPVCAERCVPSDTHRACAQPGDSCDPRTGTCQEACRSDEECRLVRDASGALVVDPSRPDFCDGLTGRCMHWGTLDARAGDPCTSDSECAVEGTCLRGGGWPDEGYCTRYDCQWAVLACESGDVCDERIFDRPSCLRGCDLGAEPEEDRLGADGHGAGCPVGLSCRAHGNESVSPSGGCVPGNYNDVAEPNVGAQCAADADCHSPYGLGRCAFTETGFGTCTVIDCASLPDICTGTCLEVDGTSHCLRACSDPSECAFGHACALTEGGSRVCIPSCSSDADCRVNEVCAERRCQPT